MDPMGGYESDLKLGRAAFSLVQGERSQDQFRGLASSKKTSKLHGKKCEINKQLRLAIFTLSRFIICFAY